MLLCDTYRLATVTGLRELEHGSDDSVTRLAHAKRIARKDEARHEFRASTSETFEFKIQFELLRLSTRFDCIILSILSMPEKLNVSDVARHSNLSSQVSRGVEIFTALEIHIYSIQIHVLIREKWMFIKDHTRRRRM